LYCRLSRFSHQQDILEIHCNTRSLESPVVHPVSPKPRSLKLRVVALSIFVPALLDARKIFRSQASRYDQHLPLY
jgi:hypothetical protein